MAMDFKEVQEMGMNQNKSSNRKTEHGNQNPRIIAASAVQENEIFESAKTTRINLPIDSFVHSVVMFSYSCVVAPTNQFTRMEPA